MLRGEGGRQGKVGGSAPRTDSWVTHLRSCTLEVREPGVGAQHQGVAFQTVSTVTILVSSLHPQGPGPQWPPEQPIWVSTGAMSKFVPDPTHAEKSAGTGGGGHGLVWMMREALHLLCAGSFAAGGPSPLVGLRAVLMLVRAGCLQGCQAQGWGRIVPSLQGSYKPLSPPFLSLILHLRPVS